MDGQTDGQTDIGRLRVPSFAMRGAKTDHYYKPGLIQSFIY